MGERELRAKYGGKLDKAINRAIRAEIPEGNAALDTLARLSGRAASSGWTDPLDHPTPEATAFLQHQRTVVNAMIGKIRQKYGITAAKRRKPARTKRKPRPSGPARNRAKTHHPRASS